MALPPRLKDGNQPEGYGIGITLIPGDPPTFQIELQRAPDNGSGGPGTFATIAQLPPVPAAITYIDLLPPDNAFRHYRWRHIGPGYDPSPSWSPIGRGKPVRLDGPAAGGGLISIHPIVRSRPLSDGKYALISDTNTGVHADPTVQLDPGNGIKEGGVVFKLYRHREEITVQGGDADGDVPVTFAQAYQATPLLFFRGGQYLSFATAFGTAVNHRQRFQALNVTTSGFTSRTQIVNTGALTARSDDFPSGNILDAVGETAEADLDPGGANDDTYTVNYRVAITLTNPGVDPLITLTVAIDINRQDGNGWIETASFVYARSTAGTSTFNTESKPIVVTGLGTNDDIRVRAKSFVVHDAPGSSFEVRGADGAGANPDARNGVTYTTATDDADSAIPDNGDQVVWVAQEVT
jgi:hypothetical protein